MSSRLWLWEMSLNAVESVTNLWPLCGVTSPQVWWNCVIAHVTVDFWHWRTLTLGVRTLIIPITEALQISGCRKESNRDPVCSSLIHDWDYKLLLKINGLIQYDLLRMYVWEKGVTRREVIQYISEGSSTCSKTAIFVLNFIEKQYKMRIKHIVFWTIHDLIYPWILFWVTKSMFYFYECTRTKVQK